MKEYFADIMSTLQNSLSSLDEEQFTKLVNDCTEAIGEGGKVIVSGLGKNVPVCDKFVGTMVSLGQNACFMNTNSAAHGDLGMVMPGDVVIILTKSGETAESVYLAKHLLERDCKLWLLTFREQSTMRQMLPNSLVLKLENEGDPWDIVPNNSTTVNLIVLQGLALHIAKKRGVTLDDFKKNHPGGFIGEQLKNV
jgi:D-arabinose 5-phosphate isomerase GutQ